MSQARKQIMRVVVTGPVGAGKTTFINTISEIETVDTDRRATDETATLKASTTVAMDFGRLNFGPDMSLHLYGTPGQERFNFMWDIFLRNAHGVVVLVPAHRPKDFYAVSRIMRYATQRAPNAPMLIAATHSDVEEAWPVEDILPALGIDPETSKIPTLPINATAINDVAKTLIALVQMYEANMLLANSASLR